MLEALGASTLPVIDVAGVIDSTKHVAQRVPA
jgi:hypothetical protein